MSGRRRNGRGLSVGTVTVLTLTALVLVGFAALFPKLTGNVDIMINASELAVAIDDSISRLASSAGSLSRATSAPDGSAGTLPPESLPTAAPVTQPPKLSFTLCATGRINTDQAMIKALTGDDGYHFNKLFNGLQDAFKADLAIATLSDNVISTDKLSDTNVPDDMLSALRYAGLSALCVGQPNALDGGIDGLRQTIGSISGAGMTPYGAFINAEAQSNAVIVMAGGVKVALLSFQSEVSSTGKKRASKEERELAFIPPDIEHISNAIARAREAGAQVVLASICWGKAGAGSPTDEQRELAAQMANAGADIILGTGSESVQIIEILTANRGDGKYHPVLCAYSMGNLVSPNRDKRAYLAGILMNARVEYDSGTGLVAFDGLQYTPTYCWRGKVDGVMTYGVLVSNKSAPEYMDKDQQSVMERCLTHIRDVLKDAALSER